MSARELDALDALREAEKLLVNHRGFVRARALSTTAEIAKNADEHERVTQALHRTREAIAHLEPLELLDNEARRAANLEPYDPR